MVLRAVLLLPLVLASAPQAWSADANDLVRVLQNGRCARCRLADADLVHADLRDADLKGAALQRANLGQARLDGANLKGADLSFTSLNGASLRGADLRGSRLYGTDLRNSDLSGAQLDPGSLEQSHWQGAQGISQGVRSHASLHNAGVTAAKSGQWKQAEKLFSAAIVAEPNEPLSWVARGLSRGELGDTNGASRDLAHAGKLFGEQGDQEKEVQLKEASQKATANLADPALRGGNGIGSQLLSGALSTAQALAPIVLRAFSPMLLP